MDHALYLDGAFVAGTGPAMAAEEPATGRQSWVGPSASDADVVRVVAAARAAFVDWSARPLDARVALLHAFAREAKQHQGELVDAITRDTGRPRWDAEQEVSSVVGKIAIAIAAYHERTGTRSNAGPQGQSVLRHRPHGVLAVLGPFNLPAHLPNGHIVPALLAGNTVVWKPSELAPLSGQALTRIWQHAGLPPSVLGMVQGGRETGAALARAEGIDGLLFTGSAAAGRALHRAFAGAPEKLLALEMGGNNPVVAWNVGEIEAAAALVVQSAFLSAGQRCTCLRRLIVADDPAGRALVEAVAELSGRLIVGPPDGDPVPFLGPVITNAAAQVLLDAQARWLANGARAIRPLRRLDALPGHDFARGRPYLSPGLVDVTALSERDDDERFGPLIQVIRVPDFTAALTEAGRTRFGLAAGLLSEDASLWARFQVQVRAGVLAWNRPLVGASSALPFGGVGQSGNHRPAAYYSADYCAYPVAASEAAQLQAPALPGVAPDQG